MTDEGVGVGSKEGVDCDEDVDCDGLDPEEDIAFMRLDTPLIILMTGGNKPLPVAVLVGVVMGDATREVEVENRGGTAGQLSNGGLFRGGLPEKTYGISVVGRED